jgi:hypothetical protein
VLATDGVDFEAEDLAGGETVACAYQDFPDRLDAGRSIGVRLTTLRDAGIQARFRSARHPGPTVGLS